MLYGSVVGSCTAIVHRQVVEASRCFVPRHVVTLCRACIAALEYILDGVTAVVLRAAGAVDVSITRSAHRTGNKEAVYKEPADHAFVVVHQSDRAELHCCRSQSCLPPWESVQGPPSFFA